MHQSIRTTVKKIVEYIKYPSKTIVNTSYHITKLYVPNNHNESNRIYKHYSIIRKPVFDDEDHYYDEIMKKIQRNGGL
jgi:hypothetical protein